MPMRILGSILLLLCSSASLACSCLDSPPALRFNAAQAVFVGQMQQGTERFTSGDGTRQLEAGAVSFTVEEAFKGALGAVVSIEVVSSRGTTCGPFGLQRGERYLIYAFASEAEPQKLYSDYCSQSVPIDSDSARDDLQFLRDLPAAGTGGTILGSVWENLRWQGRSGFADFAILLRGPKEQLMRTVTDADGHFQVTGLAPGKYRVEPQFPRGYVGESGVAEVQLDDRGTAAASFEAYVDGRVTGRLVDRTGRDFNRALLVLEPEGVAPGGAFVLGYSQGDRGLFEFIGVPPGRYRMYLELRHSDYAQNQRYYYPGTPEHGAATILALDRAQTLRDLVFTLPPGFLVRAVEGRVVSVQGKPVAHAAVGLHCARSSTAGGLAVASSSMDEVFSDADGRFRLEALTGMAYWLQARAFGADGRAAATNLRSLGTRLVAAADVRNHELVLSPSGADSCAEFAEQQAAAFRAARRPQTPVSASDLAALLAEGRQRLDANRLIDPPESSARDTLLLLRDVVPRHPEVVNLARMLSDQLLATSRLALRARAYERAAQLLRAAREMGPGSDADAFERTLTELNAARRTAER